MRLKTTTRVVGLAGLALLAMGAAFGVRAQAASTARPEWRSGASEVEPRWREAFAAFEAQDRARPVAPGGIVFVGSSSIRLWADLESAFGPQAVVVQRGFGGSRLSDCAHHADRLVVAYRPALVVVYAGDNDLAEGATPEEVAADFDRLVQRVRADLPDTRIVYVSIKPSPLRAALMDRAREANALIAARAQSDPLLAYVDVYSKMLDPQGQPRADLYAADRLHLSTAGYDLWRQEIGPRLR